MVEQEDFNELNNDSLICWKSFGIYKPTGFDS
jgi:hypothetical protein